MPAITSFFAWFSWLVMLLIALSLLFVERRNTNSWLSPLRWFVLGYIMFYVIPAFNVLYFNYMPFVVFQEMKFVKMTLGVAIGGGAYLVGWRLKQKLLLTEEKMSRGIYIHLQDILIQILLLSFVASTAIVILIEKYGGFSDIFVSSISSYERIGSGFYNIFSLIFASFIPLLSLMLLILHRFQGMKKVIIFSVILFVATIFLLVASKFGSRYRFLFVLGGALGVYMSMKRGKKVGKRVLFVLAVFGIFAFLLGNVRYKHTLVPESLKESITKKALKKSVSFYQQVFMQGDFDAFENGMELMEVVPNFRPFMWGSTLLSVLYNPIPRAIWHSKPSPSSSQYLRELSLGPARVGHYNFAVSLIAELYANFWWPGIILGMGILGFISGRLWNWFNNNRYRPEAWFHIGLFGAYLFIVQRGSFHAMTVYYLMAVFNEIASRKIAGFFSLSAYARFPEKTRDFHRGYKLKHRQR